MILKTLCIFLAAAFLSNKAQAEDIKSYYVAGESIEVCEKPDEVFHHSNIEGKPYFLKYVGENESRVYLTIVIWESDISNLEINPYSYFISENSCISGEVTRYKGQNQLVVKNFSQLTSKNRQ